MITPSLQSSVRGGRGAKESARAVTDTDGLPCSYLQVYRDGDKAENGDILKLFQSIFMLHHTIGI